MYLTFTPLPAPRRRGRPCRAGARGLSPPVSPEPGAYIRGTESPLDAEKPPEGGFLRVLRVLRVLAGLAAGIEQLSGARIVCQLEHCGTHQKLVKILLHFSFPLSFGEALFRVPSAHFLFW